MPSEMRGRAEHRETVAAEGPVVDLLGEHHHRRGAADLRQRPGDEHGVRMAQQPSPLSARGAQRVLLVGDRSDVVRHPRDGGAGLIWDIQRVPDRIYAEARSVKTKRAGQRLPSVVEAMPMPLELAEETE